MQATAQAYLIFDLTKSPLYLGYVGFAYGVPSWLFMLYGGAIADQIGAPVTVQINALFLLIAAIILVLRFPFIRAQG
jgi:nitrate/nitrite transporter NarK